MAFSRFLTPALCAVLLTINAHAASLLRITCDGKDAGADVLVNGAFKGECPIDVQVAPGTAQVRVFKKVDAVMERNWSQEVRIGDGAIKRLEATLSEPRINPEAQRAEEERQRRAIDDAQRTLASTRKAAESGDAGAAGRLGVLLFEGRWGRANDDEALTWFRKAAEGKHAPSMARLAEALELGRGTSANATEAATWYRRAAEAGDTTGMAGWGQMLAEGSGVARDEAEALRWLRKAADAGHSRGMNVLAGLYMAGQGGLPRDEAQALAWYEKAVKAPDSTQLINLMVYYRDGLYGYEKNIARAIEILRGASRQGNRVAQYNLGWAHDGGQGVAKSEDQALGWFRKAALAGDARAMTMIGVYTIMGRGGIGKDDKVGIQWYQRAAELGETTAINNLKNRGLR